MARYHSVGFGIDISVPHWHRLVLATGETELSKSEGDGRKTVDSKKFERT